MSTFVTCRHVIMLRMKVTYCTLCSFHELFEENCLCLCHPELKEPLRSVEFVIRCVLQMK